MDLIKERENKALGSIQELREARMEARAMFKALSSKIEPAPRREWQKRRNRLFIKINIKISAYIEAIDDLSRALKHFLACNEEDKAKALKAVNKADSNFIKAHEDLEALADEVEKEMGANNEKN